MNEIERWKSVVGYEGFYDVSDIGRVRSIDRYVGIERNKRIGRICKLMTDSKGSGYVFVNLSRNGKVKKSNVHVLVLEAFVGLRPYPNWHAMHIDGSRTNPSLSNLKWGTQAENAMDKLKHGTHARGENNKRSKLRIKDVSFVLESKDSSSKLASIFGVASSTIRAVRTGQNWAYSNE